MTIGRVVIATNDEWIAKLIAAPLGERGGVVVSCKTAADAIAAARAERCDAVVCDAMLPDEDAAFVATAVRQTSALATCPVLVLCHVDDAASRIAALRAGADGWIGKPFRVEEAVLQIEALMGLVRRVESVEAPPSSHVPGGGLEGDLSALSLPTVLSVLELEHRTGTLQVRGSRQTATVELHGGAPTRATLGTDVAEPLAVLRRVLRWKAGRFTFRSSDLVSPPLAERTSVGALLIEAARLEDENPTSATEAPPAPEGQPPFDDEEAPTARRDEPTQKSGAVTIPPARRAAPKTPIPARAFVPKPPPPVPPPRPKAVTGVDDIEAELRAGRPAPPPLLEAPPRSERLPRLPSTQQRIPSAPQQRIPSAPAIATPPRPRPVPPRPPSKKA